MATTTTISQLLTVYVYSQLKDRDQQLRWSRDELTQYVNLAMRDLAARRPEAGVHVDTSLQLVDGALQTLPAGVIRLKELICNEP